MNRITEHLINLFDWVWSVSIMASVLVVLIVVMQQILQHRLKPRWLYLMWLLVIARLILPWGPESEFSIYNWVGNTDSVNSVVQVNLEGIISRANVAETTVPSLNRYFLIIWLVGVCSLGIYTIWINRKFSKEVRNETVPITDVRVLELFNQCKRMMSINRTITLVESCNLATPTLFGFVKPQLIMPHTVLNRLNDDQLQHVLLHELAHSKRNDIGVNWFMHVLLIIHWFNPILWFAYRRMREDQEIASDALALSCLAPDKNQEYGYTLIKLLEGFSQPIQVAGNVNLIGSKKQLQRRITMIKQFKSNSYRLSLLGMVTLVFISGCALTNPKVNQTTTPSSSVTTSEEKEEVIVAEEANKTALATEGSKSMSSEEKSEVNTTLGSEPTVLDNDASVTSSAEPKLIATPSESKGKATPEVMEMASESKANTTSSAEPKVIAAPSESKGKATPSVEPGVIATPSENKRKATPTVEPGVIATPSKNKRKATPTVEPKVIAMPSESKAVGVLSTEAEPTLSAGD
ncbi:M56 family metallopeptidase [Paenibacillus sp. FA6]|uniref:M56 family metallopeptidase n=1 Tax=Paenibacillus sp. FA6 TaxID=3413029 RepID=UPI003F65BFEF